MKPLRQSIRRRLLTALIAAATLPLLLAGAVFGWLNYQTDIDAAYARQQEIARRVAVETTAVMEHFLVMLEAGLRLSDFAIVQNPDRQRLLDRLLALRSTFRELAYLPAAHGEALYLSNARLLPSEANPPPALREAAQAALASGQARLGAVYFDPGNNEPLMLIAVPVRHPREAAPVGAVVAEVRFKPVWNLIARLKLDREEDVYLLDADGRVLAHRNPSVVLAETRLDLSPAQRRQAGLSGGEVFVAQAPFELGGRSFRVAAEREVHAVLRHAFDGMAITAGIIVLAFAAAVGLGIALAQRISRPIIAVAATARAIRDGDLTRRTEVVSDDEIGELARAFDDMTARLRETVEALEEPRSHLEELVARRTA
ncbi:MAG: cache domain-containing protein, partial [Rhodocyclaceae bacterium]|nr:cache domain-containing protein [Rhodocyclaceae bacterium]